MAQSGSINRYLASLVKTPGFYPTDPVDLAYCDMIHETAQDIAAINPIVNVFRDEIWQQKKTDYFVGSQKGPSQKGLAKRDRPKGTSQKGPRPKRDHGQKGPWPKGTKGQKGPWPKGTKGQKGPRDKRDQDTKGTMGFLKC